MGRHWPIDVEVIGIEIGIEIGFMIFGVSGLFI
jgi:hypothetical protein